VLVTVDGLAPKPKDTPPGRDWEHSENAVGQHLLAELYDCDAALLDDLEHLRESLIAAAKGADLTVLNIAMHAFAPHGVTGIVLLSESHMSIHTWPEHAYAAVDVFTCGRSATEAVEVLKTALKAERAQVRRVERGVGI